MNVSKTDPTPKIIVINLPKTDTKILKSSNAHPVILKINLAGIDNEPIK